MRFQFWLFRICLNIEITQSVSITEEMVFNSVTQLLYNKKLQSEIGLPN